VCLQTSSLRPRSFSTHWNMLLVGFAVWLLDTSVQILLNFMFLTFERYSIKVARRFSRSSGAKTPNKTTELPKRILSPTSVWVLLVTDCSLRSIFAAYSWTDLKI
jgi:hypothetical protein